MESDNRMIAGFSPVIFPITRGTMNPSWMVCTTMNTAMAEDDYPKIPACVGGFQDCQYNSRNQTDDLKIRHHIQCPDEQTETYGQWEVYDKKAYAE